MLASLLRRGTRLALDQKYSGSGGGGGMILNPSGLRVLCAYGGNHTDIAASSRAQTCQPDGKSWTTPGAGCVPGCASAVLGEDTFCAPQLARDDWCQGKPWRPSDVDAMMSAAKVADPNRPIASEVLVLDGASFRAQQPHSVDAIFFGATEADGGKAARAMHLSFLQAFPEVHYADFPLLIYDARDPVTPFTVAPEGMASGARHRAPAPSMQSLEGTLRPPPPPPPPNGQGASSVRDPCDDQRGDYVNLACRGYGR